MHAHRLRHTLATQAINRGMSLEAIAALLGHRSMRMTLIYARIADRTVADEYYAVTEQVEALYDTAPVLPASAEGRHMRQLRVESYQRLLGNGYCTRPPELDCVFESICETSTHYQTGLEFQPVCSANATTPSNTTNPDTPSCSMVSSTASTTSDPHRNDYPAQPGTTPRITGISVVMRHSRRLRTESPSARGYKGNARSRALR